VDATAKSILFTVYFLADPAIASASSRAARRARRPIAHRGDFRRGSLAIRTTLVPRPVRVYSVRGRSAFVIVAGGAIIGHARARPRLRY
jgi:hypothetical protein